MSISYYTHHSSWGSYSSFIMGIIGKGGGFALSDVQPPDNNIYLGYKIGNKKLKLMPFFSDKTIGLDQDAYDPENKPVVIRSKYDDVEVIKEKNITREINWCTEKWSCDYLTFKLITPFDKIKHPNNSNKDETKFFIAPVIFAEIIFDNRKNNEEMTGLFGIQDVRRILSDTTGGTLLGVANVNKFGFAVLPDETISEILAWDIIKTTLDQNSQIQRLGNEGGLKFNIKPGEQKSYKIVLGTYQDGNITTNLPMQFYYTYFFESLDDILKYGIKNIYSYIDIANKKDEELKKTNFNKDKQFILSHAIRSYLANTELLIDKKAEPVFIVNEGEYQMMNTLDLTIDQAFLELYYTPWTVKNELDFALSNYSYVDTVKNNKNSNLEGGISFTHDCGVANMFSPKGLSSYELSNLDGCFSYMTHEELLNWLITAALYIFIENDLKWLNSKKDIFNKILISLTNRDLDDDGIMDLDSSRCENGSEITTYDSLDESLGQARNNLYLGVKTWAGYICLENIFNKLKKSVLAKKSGEKASKCASSILSNYQTDLGFIPAVFENGNSSKIIPAIEGLIYPWLIGDFDAVSIKGRFGNFIKTLNEHLNNVLKKGICIDEDSGGWKLSSTSKNTWMSKIFINQFIAKEILKIESNKWDEWDKIHADWQKISCKNWAATDQVRSDTGEDLGSRLYPRLITSILWMKYK